MNKNKINKIVSTFIVFPMITSMTVLPGQIPSGTSDTNVGAAPTFIENLLTGLESEVDLIEADRKAKAAKIDAYYAERNMPLEGYGYKMVVEAEKNGIDWRLVAAFSVRESTGGIQACKKATFNAWGWGSCKIGFSSYDKAIEEISAHLGGNRENTAKYYKGKSTEQIIDIYNPPHIVAAYKSQVLAIMDNIEKA